LFVLRESRDAQKNLNLRLRGRSRDRRMGDMAHLARAMSFVMGVPIKVGDDLDAQDQYRQDQRYR
jgi:hypothetical protein